jgi:peptide/nickel transport system permease protein
VKLPDQRLGGRAARVGHAVARRALLVAFTLFVSSLLIFVAAEVLPGDIGRNTLGQFASQQSVDALNAKLGVDQPMPVRYVKWLGNSLTGDFGTSTSKQAPVGDLVGRRILNSGILAAFAFALIMPVGFLLGGIAAITRGTLADRVISMTSLITTSIPEFASGVFLLLLFAITLDWLPGSSALVSEGTALESPEKLVLPVLVLALVDIGYVARMTRASTIEVMNTPYVRMARLKGLPPRWIVRRHVARNALPTPVTVAFLHLNWLVGGLVVTETIFGYPGIGQLMLDAAIAKDVPVLEAGALFFAVVAVISQLIADGLQALLTPRARASAR